MEQIFNDSLEQSLKIIEIIKSNHNVLEDIKKISYLIIQSLKNENKILFCGNGGSAADAQHLSAELSGRFKMDRDPLDAEALHVNTSYITAVANDYNYDEIFSRLVKAKGKSGDVLIGLSTSGNSKNVVKAFQAAKEKNMKIIAFTGEKKNNMEKIADICIKVPSCDTAKIQETHIILGHIICDIVEKGLFQC